MEPGEVKLKCTGLVSRNQELNLDQVPAIVQAALVAAGWAGATVVAIGQSEFRVYPPALRVGRKRRVRKI